MFFVAETKNEIKYILEHNDQLSKSTKHSGLLFASKYLGKMGKAALTELAIALMQSESFVVRNGEPIIIKHFIDDLASFFGIEIKWQNSTVTSKINNKNIKSVFLEKLTKAYENYVTMKKTS